MPASRPSSARHPDLPSPPSLLAPMLAVAGELPRASDDEDYAYEMKWDGVRAVTYSSPRSFKVLTRNGRDATATYPELDEVQELLGTQAAVLDGEVVAFLHGVPSFGRLQQRMHVTKASAISRLVHDVPIAYLVFDVLWLDGTDLVSKSYDERRELLDQLPLTGSVVQVPPAFHGGGADALQTSKDSRLEGVLAKRRASRYLPGARSRDWLKIKNLHMQEVVVGGWRPGTGRRSTSIGSLLLGVPEESGLMYVGHVGTGFTEAMLADLTPRLARLERATSPFATELARLDGGDARWVRPQLVGEVKYSERTADGRLRHPVWRGLRDDKSVADVRWES